MPVAVRVRLDEQEAAEFRTMAEREGKSLSAWLQDAGREQPRLRWQHQRTTGRLDPAAFSRDCDRRESGVEPDCETHKRTILEVMQG